MDVINPHPWKLAAVILISLYILSLTESAALPRGKGFSLKLIHPDSPNSPFYRRNLTNTQHTERLLNSSISHKKSTNINTTTTAAASYSGPRLPLVKPLGKYTFTVDVSIGSDEGIQDYQLEFDTGSSLTWTQCAGCEPSFDQDPPMFDHNKSPTYSLLPATDQLCGEEGDGGDYKPEGDKCVFKTEYADNSVVEGDLAKDTFTFQTAEGGSIEIPKMIFGCTTKSNVVGPNGQGILGMGAGEESFAFQLAPYTDKRFSYCLIPRSRYPGEVEGFLRFGDDIVMEEPFKKTTISIFPDEDVPYFLDLQDISFYGNRIGIPPSVFRRRSYGKGGVIIDTASEVSYLTPAAYELVEKFMIGHFKSHGFKQVRSQGGELCYMFKDNMRLNDLPYMTFHFKGVGGGHEGSADADLYIKGQQVFNEYRVIPAGNAFCWKMLKNTDDETILGAYQQSDTRFTYDLNRMELQFAPADCAADARRH